MLRLSVLLGVLSAALAVGVSGCLEFEPFDYTILCPNGQRVPGPSNCEFDGDDGTVAETTVDADGVGEVDAGPDTDAAPGDGDAHDSADFDAAPDGDADAADTVLNPDESTEVEVTPTCTSGECFDSVWNPAIQACVETAKNEGGACTDNNPCTTDDECVSGVCAGTVNTCDDGVECTLDSCAVDGECIHDATGCPCLQDSDCDDSNECTADTCGTDFACANAPLTGTVCEDGDGCTEGDMCAAGTCEAGAPKDCADDLSCTDDFCTSEGGTGTCQNALLAGNCLVAGECYAAGPTVDDPCQVCDPVAADDSLMPAADGDVCGTHAHCWNTQCHENTVLVPAGLFAMGCNATDCPPPPSPTVPQQMVTIPTFLIGRTEVTVDDYTACVTATDCTVPYSTPGDDSDVETYLVPDGGQLPVNFVFHAQALDYCESVGMRLCSNSEWEKAARGGCELYPTDCQAETPPWPWGTELDCTKLVSETMLMCGVTEPGAVGQPIAGASPYGALNMAGNVSEWVADVVSDSLDGIPLDGTPLTSSTSEPFLYKARSSWYAPSSDPVWSGGALQPSGPLAAQDIGFRCCVGGAF